MIDISPDEAATRGGIERGGIQGDANVNGELNRANVDNVEKSFG